MVEEGWTSVRPERVRQQRREGGGEREGEGPGREVGERKEKGGKEREGERKGGERGSRREGGREGGEARREGEGRVTLILAGPHRLLCSMLGMSNQRR